MAESVDNTLRKSRRSKAPGAFRTISEVANELEVPQHVLRFWESKFVQVKPLKRRGGRRYYRPEDIDLLRGIHHLLYTDGYTIKGAQKLLRKIGSKSIIESVRKLSEGSSYDEVGSSAEQMPSKEGSLYRENVNSSTGDTVSLAAEANKGYRVDQIQNGGLMSPQRDRLEKLAADLNALRDILLEARKG